MKSKFCYVVIAIYVSLTQLELGGANHTEQDTQYFNFNPPVGTYNYGYTVHETGQFHYERHGPDNITYGCYGHTNESGPPQIAYYVADAHGYRVVPANQRHQVFMNEQRAIRAEFRAWNSTLYLPRECSEVIHYRPSSTSKPEPAPTSPPPLLSDPEPAPTSPPPLLSDPFEQPLCDQLNDPPENDIIWRIRTTEDVCFRILEIPDEYRNLTESLQYRPVHHIKCLLRCIGIVARFYTDEGGPNLDQIYQRLYLGGGSALTREQFDQNSRTCLDAIPMRDARSPMDACERCYSVYLCFQEQFLSVLGKPADRTKLKL